MTDTNPRFTVIIPTRDRAPYLARTLATCALQEYDNLEVIVADDCSRDNTREVVESAARRDSRIRYVGRPQNIGMLENFESVLSEARPGYVLALGGDDGLMPHGIRDMADALKASGLEMLAWPTPVYFYAGVRTPSAQLVQPASWGRLLRGDRTIDSREFLARQARELSYVVDAESPMFYVKGVVSTALVDRVRQRTPGGQFYACATPDGYSGIVLAGEVRTWAFRGQPLSLHGISPTSAGFGYLTNDDTARAQSQAFFRQAEQRPMHADLGRQPYSPLIALMTADYLLTARDLPGWPGQVPDIDYRQMLEKALGELKDGHFAPAGLARELAILHGIAAHHGLDGWFRELVARARRNAREPLEGNAISPRRLYLDATRLNLEDIVDAAYFTYALHRANAALSLRTIADALVRSWRFRGLSSTPGTPFPPESEWMPKA